MPTSVPRVLSPTSLPRDILAGVVVFLVALPLCLGVALASGVDPIAGLVAGVVGGVLVGVISGSHTSVSGPAAGLTAVVTAEIAGLGSFQAFLLALVVAGALQIAMGACRFGFIAAFIPSAVLKGLLAAIGVILVLKQFPHVLGHDTDPEGEMSFQQPDHENTFSELWTTLFDLHPGAMTIGVLSIGLLVFWDSFKATKKTMIPAPLVVVIFGVGMSLLFKTPNWIATFGEAWVIEAKHRVEVPIATSAGEFAGLLRHPDWSQLANPTIYMAGLTIALVASLETLLNLEAVDKLDPRQRSSPPSRELIAQGIGNIATGLLGGIPVTSVIVRSSVNINAGNHTKVSTILHGLLLFFSVVFLPTWLNLIPISCLASILLVTGIKLASPQLVASMWQAGRYQFAPFVITFVAIVFTDLLIGVLIGLTVSSSFILYSNVRRPVRRFVEHHLGGDVMHIVLPNQVSFLNRAALSKVLDDVPRGGHVLLDGQSTDYIDPDVLSLLRDFRDETAPARKITISLLGFRAKYHFEDKIQYVDYSTRDLQASMTPEQVLRVLKEGNERFRSGQRLTRDLARQVNATADSQHPLAVVLSCTDSRSPGELIFDLGVGDLFSVRVAGNVVSRKVLGSIEFGCVVAGAKLVLVMGHTRCGAVNAAVKLAGCTDEPGKITGCQHVEHILKEIQEVIRPDACRAISDLSKSDQESFVNQVAKDSVQHTVRRIVRESETLAKLVKEGKVAIVGAMYDISSGEVLLLPTE